MDDVGIGSLALALMVLGGGYTWWAWRNRGFAIALRGAALTLMVPAAWLTGTLRMFGRMADAAVDWAAALVFRPSVWLGVVLAGIAVVMFVISGFLRARGVGGPQGTDQAPRAARKQRGSEELPPAAARPQQGGPAIVDDDMADIEAILRKRGIS